jgi:hypothetical protein
MLTLLHGKEEPSSKHISPFFKEKNSLLHGDYHMKIDLIII